MKPKDVTLHREKLGLSKPEFAEVVGVHLATIYRWENGEVCVPEPAARMIRMLAERKGAA